MRQCRTPHCAVHVKAKYFVSRVLPGCLSVPRRNKPSEYKCCDKIITWCAWTGKAATGLHIVRFKISMASKVLVWRVAICYCVFFENFSPRVTVV